MNAFFGEHQVWHSLPWSLSLSLARSLSLLLPPFPAKRSAHSKHFVFAFGTMNSQLVPTLRVSTETAPKSGVFPEMDPLQSIKYVLVLISAIETISPCQARQPELARWFSYWTGVGFT